MVFEFVPFGSLSLTLFAGRLSASAAAGWHFSSSVCVGVMNADSRVSYTHQHH